MAKQNALEQKKAAALEALISCNSLTEAAEKAGISRRTLYNYIRQDSDFAREYRRLQELAATAAAETAAARAAEASSVIKEIMDDKEQPAAIRLKAAALILETSERQRKKVEEITADCVSSTNPFFADFNFS